MEQEPTPSVVKPVQVPWNRGELVGTKGEASSTRLHLHECCAPAQSRLGVMSRLSRDLALVSALTPSADEGRPNEPVIGRRHM